MYIGIDLGTSGVKAILLNEQGEVLNRINWALAIFVAGNDGRTIHASSFPNQYFGTISIFFHYIGHSLVNYKYRSLRGDFNVKSYS